MKFFISLGIILKALLLASLTTAAVLEERASTSFDLYAYGGDGVINSLPVFYADGFAYAGWKAPYNSSVNTNITFTQSSTCLTIAPRNSSITFNSGEYLYIDVSSAAYAAVGFTLASAAPAKTTTGFIFYGSWAMWESSTGTITSLFYATPTTQDGLYLLKWNEGVVDDGESIAVALKKRLEST